MHIAKKPRLTEEIREPMSLLLLGFSFQSSRPSTAASGVSATGAVVEGWGAEGTEPHARLSISATTFDQLLGNINNRTDTSVPPIQGKRRSKLSGREGSNKLQRHPRPQKPQELKDSNQQDGPEEPQKRRRLQKSQKSKKVENSSQKHKTFLVATLATRGLNETTFLLLWALFTDQSLSVSVSVKICESRERLYG